MIRIVLIQHVKIQKDISHINIYLNDLKLLVSFFPATGKATLICLLQVTQDTQYLTRVISKATEDYLQADTR